MADFVPPPLSSREPPGEFFPPALSERETDSTALGDFARGAWSKLNPLEMIKGMGETAKALGEHPIDTALSVLAHPYNALKRAKVAMDAGKLEEAAAHVVAAINPVGFMTEGSQVKMATPGKRAEGLGELLGTGLGAYLTAKIPNLAGAVKGAPGAIMDALDTTPTGAALRAAASKVKIPIVNDLITEPVKAGFNAYRDVKAKQAITDIPTRVEPPALPDNTPVDTTTGETLRPVDDGHYIPENQRVPRGRATPNVDELLQDLRGLIEKKYPHIVEVRKDFSAEAPDVWEEGHGVPKSARIPVKPNVHNLPEIGDTIEWSSGQGVLGNAKQTGVVQSLRKSPVTGDLVPVVKIANGNEWPVSEWYDNGRVVSIATHKSAPVTLPADSPLARNPKALELALKLAEEMKQ